jgi:hypothetical protein
MHIKKEPKELNFNGFDLDAYPPPGPALLYSS